MADPRPVKGRWPAGGVAFAAASPDAPGQPWPARNRTFWGLLRAPRAGCTCEWSTGGEQGGCCGACWRLTAGRCRRQRGRVGGRRAAGRGRPGPGAGPDRTAANLHTAARGALACTGLLGISSVSSSCRLCGVAALRACRCRSRCRCRCRCRRRRRRRRQCQRITQRGGRAAQRRPPLVCTAGAGGACIGVRGTGRVCLLASKTCANCA